MYAMPHCYLHRAHDPPLFGAPPHAVASHVYSIGCLSASPGTAFHYAVVGNWSVPIRSSLPFLVDTLLAAFLVFVFRGFLFDCRKLALGVGILH